MDDLDALLADLQNSATLQQQHFIGRPPELSNRYQNNSAMSRKLPYRQELVYEFETQPDDAGIRKPQCVPHHNSNLSTNLSELDNLLQELSSAQFAVEVDRRSSGNLSNSSMLNSGNSTLASNPMKKSSSATNELDELMSSLSCMTSSEPEPSLSKNDILYSYPQQQTTNQNQEEIGNYGRKQFNDGEIPSYDLLPPPSVNLGQRGKMANSNDMNLNAMFEDLNKNMSLQGVNVIPRGHCAACAKLIVGQVITALGQLWHPEHFVCVHCKNEIGTENFFERDGMPYCEHDYHYLFSPRCAQCSGPILDKCVTALDKTWHPEHFACYSCGRELGDEGFHEKDGLIFCRDDYFQHFAPKCGMCGQSIIENFITALNQQWHPKCFACFDCHKPFGTSSFYEHDGYPYCETHYHAKKGSLCAQCGKPISGRCITAMFRKFHPDHFICTYCQKPLTKGTFKEENDKPYCHGCFVKLFS